MGSYLSPGTGVLPAGAQGQLSSWNDLSGAASLGWFPPGPGYISWDAGRAHKVIPEKAPEGAAGSTKGGVAALCVGLFVFGASPLSLPLSGLLSIAATPSFPPTLGQSAHRSGKSPGFFPTRLALCISSGPLRFSGTLWARLSTPSATLSGAIVFKSRTKCSLHQQLRVFICLCEWYSW